MDAAMAVFARLGTPARTAGAVLALWVGSWSMYYVAQESFRCLELRRRAARHRLRLRRESPDAWHGNARGKERVDIVARFRSLRFCGRYLNVAPEWREQGAWEWMWWKLVHSALWHGRLGWDGGVATDQQTAAGRAHIEQLLPVHALDTAQLWGAVPGAPRAPRRGLSHTWIGQSTCLVQLHGVNVLTDPVFGEQPIASVVSPWRIRPMPCTLQELLAHGRVDVILVSHNHFDHLDVAIIPHIPRGTRWVVPRGVGALLARHGVACAQVTELDWWDEASLQLHVPVRDGSTGATAARTLDIAAVPASHWSARNLLDTNLSLWNSYALRCAADDGAAPAKFFFCGDSGYSPLLFSSIGRMYGPFHLATIPIGSYEPRWHLSLQHMDPLGAVRVALDVGAKQAFAMHWGTWCMSDERWDDAPRDLEDARKRECVPPAQLCTVPFGTTQIVAGEGW
ncbi:N-acetylphosphatidylethanolamine-hydrolyzing phospholipase D [Malassezia sp. CBS 17886]|nr:N-acetylphosphatidylethanolamine-hydrolyzing phospholipase D [Malassezia sp. CBS 17886]